MRQDNVGLRILITSNTLSASINQAFEGHHIAVEAVKMTRHFLSTDYTDYTERLLAAAKRFHPERMNVSSRGRAALRESPRVKTIMVLTLKGSQDENGCTLSGSDILSYLTVGFAQSRSPTAIKFGPSRTMILPKKQELVVCYTDFLFVISKGLSMLKRIICGICVICG
jgi:hypothetical protein